MQGKAVRGQAVQNRRETKLKRKKRFERQFEALARLNPKLRWLIKVLREDRWRWVRLPLAILMTLGGFAWFLPLLGLWMLPFGLLLLAVDLPFMRGPVSAGMILARRRIDVWSARWRAWRAGGQPS